ncbi:hypothetical protein GXW78_05890 [Roseomonas terrae]|jgi:hypothetical protein|uniref:Uncharacterized protein n=1 Tax=Neoroseomonas terrae TaxID=424799 RepID=A0ABS5EDU5_9PROT|nr:hypothetical protein [Neoroseomonas terrae]MBR0649185.1 hypothetical protein [Neoroseomonas terrae]
MLLILGLLVPTAASSEVLDKFPSLPELWLATGMAMLIGTLLAYASRWTLLVTWPLSVWCIGFGLLQDFHSPEIGRAVLREGGWSIAVNWHLIAFASAAWPLLFLVRRWKPREPSGAIPACMPPPRH